MAKKSFDDAIRAKIRDYGVLAVVVVEKTQAVGPLMESLMKADLLGLELTLRERIFRIGHMGYSAQAWLVNRVAAAIRGYLHG